jgi:hypothetical protein
LSPALQAGATEITCRRLSRVTQRPADRAYSSATPIAGSRMSLQKMMPALPGAKLWAVIVWPG